MATQATGNSKKSGAVMKRIPSFARRDGAADNDGGGALFASLNKENYKHQTDSNLARTPSVDTPNNDNEEEGTPNPLLSPGPTPYWKTVEERGGKTSPRTTRSATKKKLVSNMLELEMMAGNHDDEEEHTNSSDSSVAVTRLALFQPPASSAFTNATPSSYNNASASRRQQHQREAERVRQQKVRKAVDSALDEHALGIGGFKRRNKKIKTQQLPAVDTTSSSDDANTTTSNSDLQLERMQQIIQEQLTNQDSTKLEQQIAKTATAERDAQHHQSRYQELELKYSQLESRYNAREQELQSQYEKYEQRMEAVNAQCLERREVIARYEMQLEHYESKCGEMEGRHLQVCDGLREQLAKEKEVGSERDRELMVLKDERIAAEQKFQQVTGELTSVNEKLREVTARNDELEAMKINDSSSAGEVQCHLLELQGKYNEVKEELRAAQLSVESKSSKIAQLESTIEKINERHDGRMKQLQESSAAEKSAVNSQNAELLSRLENQLQSVQQDLENAREELKVAHVKMEGMESLQTKEATEDNHAREVAMFKNKINTLESRLRDNEVELESKLEATGALRRELSVVKGENEDLSIELCNTKEELEVAQQTANNTTIQMNHQSEELQAELNAANDELTECRLQLEEIANENEGLVGRLEATERGWEEAKVEVQSAKERKIQLEESLAVVSNENNGLMEEVSRARQDISNLQQQVSAMEEELAISQHEVSSLQQMKQASDAKMTELSSQLATLTSHLQNAQSKIQSLESQLKAKEEYCDQFESLERKLVHENFVLNEIRRKLHNRVIQLSGNIRVFVRVRPLIESEKMLAIEDGKKKSGSCSRPSSAASSRPSSRGSLSSVARGSSQPTETTNVSPFHFPAITDRSTTAKSFGNTKSPNATTYSDLTKQTIELTEPYKDRGGLNPRQKKYRFGFDRVYNPTNDQEDVWEGAQPLVQSAIDGFDVCMFGTFMLMCCLYCVLLSLFKSYYIPYYLSFFLNFLNNSLRSGVLLTCPLPPALFQLHCIISNSFAMPPPLLVANRLDLERHTQ